MKFIKYKICTRLNTGTEDEPKLVDVLYSKEMEYNEVNLATAEKEAYNGEYTIEDDGEEETGQPVLEERVANLEEALDMILSGVTE